MKYTTVVLLANKYLQGLHSAFPDHHLVPEVANLLSDSNGDSSSPERNNASVTPPGIRQCFISSATAVPRFTLYLHLLSGYVPYTDLQTNPQWLPANLNRVPPSSHSYRHFVPAISPEAPTKYLQASSCLVLKDRCYDVGISSISLVALSRSSIISTIAQLRLTTACY